MNSHIRCTNCHSYIPAEDVFRVRGLSRFCSEECFIGYSQPKKVTKIPKFSRGGADSSTARKKERTVVDNDIPEAVRRRVMARDRFRCRFCGSPDRLHVHHITYRSGGGTHDETNLIVLCLDHHDKVHSDKRRWAKVCRAYIWYTYVHGEPVLVPTLEHRLKVEGVIK